MKKREIQTIVEQLYNHKGCSVGDYQVLTVGQHHSVLIKKDSHLLEVHGMRMVTSEKDIVDNYDPMSKIINSLSVRLGYKGVCVRKSHNVIRCNEKFIYIHKPKERNDIFMLDTIGPEISTRLGCVLFKFGLYLPEADIDYLDYSANDKTKISYISADRQHLFDSVWSSAERKKYAYKGKPAKVLRKINPCIQPSILEAISNKIKADAMPVDIGIIGPEKIPEIYTSDKITPDGTLGHSCMNGKPRSRFKIYADLAQGMIIAKKGDTILARAILWKIPAKNGKTMMFLDRIYSNSDETERAIIEYAQKQGYTYKKEQNYEEKLGVVKEGEYQDLELSIPVGKLKYQSVPYFDTFSYYNIEEETLNNFWRPDGLELVHPDGSVQFRDDRISPLEIYNPEPEMSTVERGNTSAQYLTPMNYTIGADSFGTE